VGPSGRVTTIDIDPQLARKARAALRAGGYRVDVRVGDGHDGLAAFAPYDRIIVTASAATVPQAWIDQLADGGLVEVPLRLTASGDQVIATLRKTSGGLATESVIHGGFMPLRSVDGTNPDSVRQPSLIAHYGATAEPSSPLFSLTGSALASLSASARRSLLSVALTEGRRLPLGLRVPFEPVWLYLTLTLPTNRVVRVSPGWAVGLISRDGRSLAYIESRGREWVSSIRAHGTTTSADDLAAVINRWASNGRPAISDLKFSIDPRANGTRPLKATWGGERLILTGR
jgi:hypothetical protein